jgi:predicted enzyme related to lactoylglutathione lyase
VAKVAALGGSVVAPPQDIPQGRFAAFSDPHGAMFNVIALAG